MAVVRTVPSEDAPKRQASVLTLLKPAPRTMTNVPPVVGPDPGVSAFKTAGALKVKFKGGVPAAAPRGG